MRLLLAFLLPICLRLSIALPTLLATPGPSWFCPGLFPVALLTCKVATGKAWLLRFLLFCQCAFALLSSLPCVELLLWTCLFVFNHAVKIQRHFAAPSMQCLSGVCLQSCIAGAQTLRTPRKTQSLSKRALSVAQRHQPVMSIIVEP